MKMLHVANPLFAQLIFHWCFVFRELFECLLHASTLTRWRSSLVSRCTRIHLWHWLTSYSTCRLGDTRVLLAYYISVIVLNYLLVQNGIPVMDSSVRGILAWIQSDFIFCLISFVAPLWTDFWSAGWKTCLKTDALSINAYFFVKPNSPCIE
jgi:hypothetical protein